MAAERFEKAPEAPHRSGSEVSSRQAGIGESEAGTGVVSTHRAKSYVQHEKEKVEWDDAPNLADSFDGDIPWYGTCSCGKRVYEIYTQQPEVYEA
jgi:hypothetical protein